MAPFNKAETLWFNGAFVPWDDARVHVMAHGLHYGTGVFEGIRSYDTDDGPAVFRLGDHLERLHQSARLLHMELPYPVDELRRACHELIGENGLSECYLRPIAFYGYGELGVHPGTNPVDVVIMSWPWGAYLGEDALAKGIRAKVSSWKRVGPNTIPHAAKATGIYLNSMLAVIEATRARYEGGILPGITRQAVMEIAQTLGYAVHERQLIRSDLYVADEVFMCGTAAEVTPVRSVDDHEIGPPGPVTKAIQAAFFDAVRGRDERWSRWLEYAEKTPAAPGS